MGNNILYISIYIIITNISFNTSFVTSKFVTQTVYGFLDFTTTIGSTVMVFSPESAPTLNFKETKIEAVKVIETKPIKYYGKEVDAFINPTKLLINNSSMSETVKLSLPMKIRTHSEFVMSKHKNGEMENTVAYIESNLYKPEYNLLSRQPTEYVEETFKLVNINPNLRNNKFRFSSSRICGIDNSKEKNAPGNGITSTCISSKYIQNTLNPIKNMKAKISSTLTPRILKTAVPLSLTGSDEDLQGYRQPGLSKKVQTRNFSSSLETTAFSQKTTERTTTQGKQRKSPNRSKSKRRNKHSQNSESEKRTLRTQSPIEDGRRSYRLKTHISTTTETDTASSIFMLKLNRTPGRWQYKTSPKPKINIRKPVSGNNVSSVYTTTTFSTDLWRNDSIVKNSSNVDLESSGSQSGAIINKDNFEGNQKLLVETLNIEISTPVDFQNVYYEIATIKTPYSFQAGVVKKTRYITVTSTFQKTLEPEVSTSAVFEGPLTENILMTSVNADELQLDGSITTLLPLSLTDNEETPRLEVTTDSYTFTKKKFATKVLPIVRENATSYVTAVQTYEIKNIITVTKTLLPHDTNEFIASRNLKDFNINLDEAGSEINFDLEFADEDNLENVKEDKLNSIHFSKNNTINNIVPTSHLNQNSLINIFNSISQNPPIFTNHTVVKMHTLWKSHILPVINGLSTTYRTISKSVGIIDRTEYELNTIQSSVEPQISVNPFLLPAPQQFQTITSPLLQQTYVTETSSKVLKLTFGAKTAYTTLFSTQVLPKIVTSFVTTSIPVQATVAYPGYYPPPYAPFPYVG